MDFPIDIRQFLPHRAPMLMTQDIIEMDEQSIVTHFKITENNIFQENGCFTEIGLIENAAQTCSGIVGRPQFEAQAFRTDYNIQGFISKIVRFDILDLPKVGDEIVTKGALISQIKIGTFYNCVMQSNTFVQNHLIAKGKFNLIIQP